MHPLGQPFCESTCYMFPTDEIYCTPGFYLFGLKAQSYTYLLTDSMGHFISLMQKGVEPREQLFPTSPSLTQNLRLRLSQKPHED